MGEGIGQLEAYFKPPDPIIDKVVELYVVFPPSILGLPYEEPIRLSYIRDDGYTDIECKVLTYPTRKIDITQEQLERIIELVIKGELKGYIKYNGRISIKSKGEDCPICGSPILYQEGCKRCPNCGWSACLIS